MYFDFDGYEYVGENVFGRRLALLLGPVKTYRFLFLSPVEFVVHIFESGCPI